MIVLRTSNPKELLNAIYAAIDKADGKKGTQTMRIKERVITWGYDEDRYFHHDPNTSNNWARKARFHAEAYDEKGILVFFIKKAKGKNDGVTRSVYAIYHGRFLSMLLTHFSDDFSIENITTKPFHDDWKAYYNTL